MRSSLLDREIREEDLLPGYFFYGEELFRAHQFIRDLKAALVSPDVQGIGLERFDLEETPWRDIMDVARTMPFFFSPWRLLVVEIEDADREELTPAEQKILKEYFASPAPKTIIVVLFAGKIRKTKPLFKLFSSLPGSAVLVNELKALKDKDLSSWVNGKLASLGKRASPEAIERLIEMTGNDLQRLTNELEKLATYTGDKRLIEVVDVNLLSDWVKNYLDWELTASLAKGDLEQGLMILNKRFQEGDRPEYVLNNLTNFFRNLLAAKSWLREKRDRKDIFREFNPRITEKMGYFYRSKLEEFFSLVEGLTQKDLSRLIGRLGQVDLKIKTTDTSPQALFESFIYEYCRLRK
jgi:DNA polymerase III delta subunit